MVETITFCAIAQFTVIYCSLLLLSVLCCEKGMFIILGVSMFVFQTIILFPLFVHPLSP